MTQSLHRESAIATETTKLTVLEVARPTTDSVVMSLAASNGAELPEWTPGAHIDLVLGDNLVRQYSLCGDPSDRSRWRIGVLLEPESRGGSQFVHENVQPGSTLTARGPRNHFPLVDSEHYLFIAGGIGITPILAMVREAEAKGAQWQLLYGGRRRSSMVFLDELAAYADNVDICPQDERGLLDLASYLGKATADTAVYCCGPEPLIAATEAICATENLSLHVERFTPRQDTEGAVSEEFEVYCAESDVTVTVPADSTILAEVRKAGIEVLSSCSEGTCGTCETDILEGEPDHRDSVLTPEEREAGESMMICVSRCAGKRLVLDL